MTSAQPAVLYNNTFCTARVTGRLPGEASTGRCEISGLTGLLVEFTSGVSGALAGRFFPIGAIFTATATSGSSVTAGKLKIIDGAPLDGTLTGTGQIAAVFDVVFTTPLSADCRSGRGYLVPTTAGTITIRN